MDNVRVAIAGIGNCASSLIQGIEYYRTRNESQCQGLMHESIGGWGASDVQVVAAFDVDRRKVGQPLERAVFAAPNCTRVFQPTLPPSGVAVQMGPVLDGVADHMENYGDDEAFRPADEAPVDVVAALRDSQADVLICYLPVGSEQAVRHYARACLDAGVAMVNCVPVFLASDPEWAARFRSVGLPIVGDDIKSQVGATIVHRTLGRLFADRGINLDRTYQLNTGGNTDVLNMLEDRVGPEPARRAAGCARHSHRSFRLRALAGRQQGRLHPDGGARIRRCAARARAQTVGPGLSQQRGGGDRRGAVRQARPRAGRIRSARGAERLLHEEPASTDAGRRGASGPRVLPGRRRQRIGGGAGRGAGERADGAGERGGRLKAPGARVVEPLRASGLRLPRRGRAAEVRPRPRDHGGGRIPAAGASR